MRILYGITGEGLGHTMRARVVLPHLVARGHEVLVAASARASVLFDALGYDVLPIEGLAIRYRDGAAQRLETLALNARRAPHAAVACPSGPAPVHHRGARTRGKNGGARGRGARPA